MISLFIRTQKFIAYGNGIACDLAEVPKVLSVT